MDLPKYNFRIEISETGGLFRKMFLDLTYKEKKYIYVRYLESYKANQLTKTGEKKLELIKEYFAIQEINYKPSCQIQISKNLI